MEGTEKTGATTEGSGSTELEQKKAELATLNEEIGKKNSELEQLDAEIEQKKAAIERLNKQTKVVEKPDDDLSDIEDIRIVYGSFHFNGKHHEREELIAKLNQGEEDSYELIKELIRIKSGAIEIVKRKEVSNGN